MDEQVFPLDCHVYQTTVEANGVVSLGLRAANGQELPRWTPGAHIDLELPSGLVRQYSLCGDPQTRDHYLIAVRLSANSEGGSKEIHDSLLLGRTLKILGLRNHFELDLSRRRDVFIAGGIGVTPILPMVEEASALGRPWTLLYIGHGRKTMPFIDRLEQLPDRENVKIVDTSQASRPIINQLIGEVGEEVSVYVCGPQGMIDEVVEHYEDITGCDVHFERFKAGAPKIPLNEDPNGFEVVLARSNRTFIVGPNETILDVLVDAGVSKDYFCQEGYCGTCETSVLEGEPEHRDSILSKKERESGKLMFPCVSRSLSKTIVLDL